MKRLTASLLPTAPWLLVFATVCNAATAAEFTLRYDSPARDWESEALPIGNGRMGAMLFGGLAQDRVQFNEITLWTGNEDVMGAYQAFGDLNILLPGHDAGATEYLRELDLSEGAGRLTYLKDGVTYRREYFASHPAQVIVIRLTADKPGVYTGEIELADMHNAPTVVEGNRMISSGGLTLAMTQQARRGGFRGQPQRQPAADSPGTMSYESQVIVRHEGGESTVSGSRIALKGCNSVTILLGTGTSYLMDYQRRFQGEHPHQRLTAQMDAAAAKSYEELRNEHQKDYLSLFGRVALDLGNPSADRAGLTTDRRIEVYNRQGNDPALEAMLFQYGRYLLMSCSRDSLPANLQGLWNDRNDPPWNADYHTNINVQMNYWPAEPANLGECHLQLLNLVRALTQPFHNATAAEFPLESGEPVRGWTVRTSHNPFGNMSYVWNMGGNAWYAQHFWEHYAFSLDEQYLREMAYPIMKEACEFWEDHLKALPDGRLVVPNGWSPEHGPRNVDGVTYDQMMVWDLLTNTIEAADVLQTDRAYRDRLAQIRDRLVGPKIGRWGQLQEWMDDIDDPKDQHRHTSHLFGVFPGQQVSVARTPELAEAARVSLEARGSSGDSRRQWAWAWRCALWARLGQADKAHEMIRGLLAYNTLTNLLGNHPPMQMDGNWGITAAICEMLLQSHAGQIHLLPALPSAWPTGSISGLCARGGFEVDIAWVDGQLTAATVRSRGGQECTVRCENNIVDVSLAPGESWSAGPSLD